MDWSLAKLSCPWDFLGKNTGGGCHFFLQGLQFWWRWWWLRNMDGIYVWTHVRTCINVHSVMYVNGGILRKEWCWSWSSSAWATWCEELTHWKRPDAGKDWRQEEKGTTEDEMVGWYHWLDRHEFKQSPGVGDGQGSMACCSPWGRKESDMPEWLNWSD